MSTLIQPTAVPGRPALRLGRFSTVWRPRSVIVCVALVVVGALLFAASIGSGKYPMSVLDVLRTLAGGGSSIERLVVFEWRMPRAISGVAVGLALGLAGALAQSVTRNALASPDILGITSGASAAAVTVIVFSGAGAGATGAAAWLDAAGVPLTALAGAMLTAAVIWVLAWRRSADPYRLVLFGIIITALLQAYVNWLMTSANITDATEAQFWLAGSLGHANWARTLPISLLVVAAAPLLGWLSFKLLAALLGPETAAGLGQNVRATQLMLLAVSVALAAVSVAAAGPIGFVSFVAPQLALRLCRVPSPPLVASALTGGVLLVGADLVTQTLLPVELPVGLLTAALGGAFLIYLLVHTNRRQSA